MNEESANQHANKRVTTLGGEKKKEKKGKKKVILDELPFASGARLIRPGRRRQEKGLARN